MDRSAFFSNSSFFHSKIENRKSRELPDDFVVIRKPGTEFVRYPELEEAEPEAGDNGAADE